MKAILKIVSFDKEGRLTLFSRDEGIRKSIKDVVLYAREKQNGFLMADLTPVRKKRTTGDKSQNSHIWGHIQQIAEETGNEAIDVENYVKELALKRGYPVRENKLTGKMIPVSMTRIDTVQAGYLIDELHILAGELGIMLREE